MESLCKRGRQSAYSAYHHPGSVRGFIASGRLDLAKLDLKPGTYIVNVGFDIGEKEPVFARPSEFTITP